jgi:hypothetical protein
LHKAARNQFKEQNPSFVGLPKRGMLDNIKYEIVLKPNSMFRGSTWYPKAVDKRNRELKSR